MKAPFLAFAIFLALNIPAQAKRMPASAQAPSGQLTFALQSAGPALNLARLDKAGAYGEMESLLQGKELSGAQVLAAVRSLDPKLSEISTSITLMVAKIVDPQAKFADDFYAMLDANPWASPIFQYARGDDSDDEQIYVTVNRELRDGKPDSPKVAAWVKKMREALWHIPPVQGLSFRGTRLTPARIQKLYPVGQAASDAAFISSSLDPSTALKFAAPNISGDAPKPGTIAVLFILRGKNGRPISAFAQMMGHEQEILFANGTPFRVEKASQVFQDKELGPTQILLLSEK